MDSLHIEYIPTTSLKAYDRNARTHRAEDVAAIKESIQQFGFNDPIGVWKDNLIIEGHGRLMAAQELGMDEVPVIRLDHLTDEERRAYALAHNKTAELSEWNFRLVEQELKEIATIDMSAFQFEIPESWFNREDRDNTDEEEGNEEYNEFLEKFETKKTTDDCYTPDVVYNAVADWVANEYGLDRSRFVRPFYPGGDYVKEDYRPGDVVVDNPPFSIEAQIIRFYQERGIPFFLFAHALTNFKGKGAGTCAVCANIAITYENGAKVPTGFCTNLEHGIVARTAPELYKAATAAAEEYASGLTKTLPKYSYPDEIVTAALLSRWSKYGIDFRLNETDCELIAKLEAMGDSVIYGGGYILSERAAAERAAAERAAAERAAAERAAAERAAAERAAATRWELSEKEREIVRRLSAQGRVGQEDPASE